MSSGQVQTIPLKPMWWPLVWNQYEMIAGGRPLSGLLCAPYHRLVVMCSGTWRSLPHHGAVPLKMRFSQEGYRFWRFRMTFWLQGNTIPSVCIFLDALLYTEGKIMVPEDTRSLSISAMGWESQGDFRVVSAGRCHMFLRTIGLCSRACDMEMFRLLPGSHHWFHLQPCHACPRCCNMSLKTFVYPVKVLGEQTGYVLLAKLLSTFRLKGILKVHCIFSN